MTMLVGNVAAATSPHLHIEGNCLYVTWREDTTTKGVYLPLTESVKDQVFSVADTLIFSEMTVAHENGTLKDVHGQ